MPELTPELLLKYSESPPDKAFVADVMQSVRRKHRTRKMILFISGIVGALFGLSGAVMLSDKMTQFFTFSAAAISSPPVSLAVLGVVLFLGWLLNDEMSNG